LQLVVAQSTVMLQCGERASALNWPMQEPAGRM
jgi:hypothetical protein